MRLRFFLCASADLGVRRSKVVSSFCRSGYIVVSEITQAGSRAAIRLPGGGKPPGVCILLTLRLKEELQSKLHQPRVASLCDLAKLCSVRAIALRVKELRVIEDIEQFRPEIHSSGLRDLKGFQQREVGIADTRTTAYSAWRRPDPTEQARIVATVYDALGTIHNRVRRRIRCDSCIFGKTVLIEEVVPVALRLQRAEGRQQIRFARQLKIEAVHQLIVGRRRDANGESGLKCRNS